MRANGRQTANKIFYFKIKLVRVKKKFSSNFIILGQSNESQNQHKLRGFVLFNSAKFSLQDSGLYNTSITTQELICTYAVV